MGGKSQNISMHVFTFHIFDAFIDKIGKGRQKMGRRGGMTQARFKLASLKRATCHLIVLQFTFVAVKQ